MSSYYPSFNLFEKNSYDDYGLVVTHFEADDGESDTFLGMDPIYSDRPDGTRRIDYGAKFNSVIVSKISVIKSDGTDFSVLEVRNFLKWTTGSRKNSFLELCEWDEATSAWSPKFRLLGRTTAAYQQKLDARTVGLIIEFTTVSPFAFSPVQTISREISGSETFIIENETDDIDTPIYLNVRFENSKSGDLIIRNETIIERIDEDLKNSLEATKRLYTKVTGLVDNEIITLDSNLIITSDQPAKTTFGNTFNFVYPQLTAGTNRLTVEGNGTITMDYVYCMKIGDHPLDVDTSSANATCDCTGDVDIDEAELTAMLEEVLS